MCTDTLVEYIKPSSDFDGSFWTFVSILEFQNNELGGTVLKSTVQWHMELA